MSQWKKSSFRAWVSCTISGLTLTTFAGHAGAVRAEETVGQISRPVIATETRISRNGRKISRPLLPQTPRRQIEDGDAARSPSGRTESQSHSNRVVYAGGSQSLTPQIVQVQLEQDIETTGSESEDGQSPVQRKLRELYEKDNLEAPPMTLEGVNRRNNRRSAQRPKVKNTTNSETEEQKTETHKPSLLSRLNPFGRSNDNDSSAESEGDLDDLDADEAQLVPEPESRTKKLVKHYRKPSQRRQAGGDSESPSKAKSKSSRARSEDEVARGEKSRKLPRITPQEQPTPIADESLQSLPQVVPNRDEIDVDLPLPAETTNSSETTDTLPLEPEPARLESIGDDAASVDSAKKIEAVTQNESATESEVNPTEVDVDPAIEAKMQLIAARGSVPGLKGFCPVTLKNDRELHDAKAEFNSIFQGVVYGFSSAEAKDEFDRHPEQYAPMSQGHDVVLKASEIAAPGSLDYALWFKDRLYLFSSPETLDEFSQSPEQYVD
ncbi:MAG: hypothetical protein ACKVT0_18740 [Planctomycetaceae bacterium]